MNSYYKNTLYPLQDKVLTTLNQLDTPFYLTGGTALSRVYLHHRYSDDLDFFVNQDPNFTQHAQDFIQLLSSHHQLQILHRSNTFYRFQVDQILKIELINDVAYHYGPIASKPLFKQVDNPLNILSNKITALISRDEPKDIIDIWAIAQFTSIDWPQIFQDANSKAVGVFPPQIAEKLSSFSPDLLDQIKWIQSPPKPSQFRQDIDRLCHQILFPTS